MEISFQTKSLRAICEITSRARKQLGAPSAEVLRRRLADLRAANAVTDLLAGRPRPLPGRANHIVLDLDSRRRLVFCPNHPVHPIDAAETVDWAKVYRVKIVEILEDPNV